MTHANRALQGNGLSGKGINSGSHTYFLTTSGHREPPRWVISSMPGPPSRQHEHERRYTPVTHTFILTRRIWKDDNYGQMIFGDFVCLKFPIFVLQVRKNPEKISPRKRVPTGYRTRAHCVDRRACYRLLHSGGQVLKYIFIIRYFMNSRLNRLQDIRISESLFRT